MKKKIRIGNAGGFWGDDLNALKRQLEGGDLDYITSDYLAEITMSILRKQQLKNPEMGYVHDFVEQILDNAEIIKRKGVKVISNAGGINPSACAEKIIIGLKEKKIDLKVAIVEGDDIIDQIDEIYPEKTDLENMETGEAFAEYKDRILSANVYLGFRPIYRALEHGADIIVTGRVTDTSITMAPMIYEFGWEFNDWDKLASALIAGHIIECGAQSSGGNFTDWKKVKNWENFGYPVVEVYSDSSFIVTKNENTGGLVSIDTVKEQLLYEMGDPMNYISPDVVVDFLSINLQEAGENRVKVNGIKGRPSTKFFKVSMVFTDGYKASSAIIISGPDAKLKAEYFCKLFWKRLGIDFEKTNTEMIGYNSCHLNLAKDIEPNEILLNFSVFDHNKSKIGEFAKSIASLILSGPPGVAVTGGRPKIKDVMTFYPSLIPKELIKARYKVFDNNGIIEKEDCIPCFSGFEENFEIKDCKCKVATEVTESEKEELVGKKIRIREICLARSGDKGDTVNIGVIARNEKIFKFIKKKFTAQFIKNMFSQHCKGKVIRYKLNNLMALNFLLEQSLDGGGTKSLMIDAQGKTFAAALLSQEIFVPEDILK